MPVSAFLDGAFALRRSVADPVPDMPETAPTASPAAGSGDEVSATGQAQGTALAVLVVGVVLAVALANNKEPLQVGDGVVAFAGFYIAAQAIERLLELLPAGKGTKQAKANRAVVFGSLGFLLAVLAVKVMGLYYLQAVGADVSRDLDCVITALAIGGGTKPLHDAIKRIEKSKQTPPSTT